ncbi:MAG: hypothetical protein JXR33_02970 [Coriobacteriia bacterium]|nr:hypothetical protein [Coriobacteriia bacterium]
MARSKRHLRTILRPRLPISPGRCARLLLVVSVSATMVPRIALATSPEDYIEQASPVVVDETDAGQPPSDVPLDEQDYALPDSPAQVELIGEPIVFSATPVNLDSTDWQEGTLRLQVRTSGSFEMTLATTTAEGAKGVTPRHVPLWVLATSGEWIRLSAEPVLVAERTLPEDTESSVECAIACRIFTPDEGPSWGLPAGDYVGQLAVRIIPVATPLPDASAPETSPTLETDEDTASLEPQDADTKKLDDTEPDTPAPTEPETAPYPLDGIVHFDVALKPDTPGAYEITADETIIWTGSSLALDDPEVNLPERLGLDIDGVDSGIRIPLNADGGCYEFDLDTAALPSGEHLFRFHDSGVSDECVLDVSLDVLIDNPPDAGSAPSADESLVPPPETGTTLPDAPSSEPSLEESAAPEAVLPPEKVSVPAVVPDQDDDPDADDA